MATNENLLLQSKIYNCKLWYKRSPIQSTIKVVSLFMISVNIHVFVVCWLHLIQKTKLQVCHHDNYTVFLNPVKKASITIVIYQYITPLTENCHDMHHVSCSAIPIGYFEITWLWSKKITTFWDTRYVKHRKKNKQCLTQSKLD